MKKVNKFLASLLASFCMLATVTPALAEETSTSETTDEITNVETQESTSEEPTETLEDTSNSDSTTNETTESSTESAPTYTISFADKNSKYNDLVGLDFTSAKEGDTVSLSVTTPEKKCVDVTAGYVIEGNTYYGVSNWEEVGSDLDITFYTFTMPAHDVYIYIDVSNDLSVFDTTKYDAAINADNDIWDKIWDKYKSYDSLPESLKQLSDEYDGIFTATIFAANYTDELTQAKLDQYADEFMAYVKRVESAFNGTEATVTSTTSSKTPKTSDNSSVLFYGATLLITLVAGVGFVFFRKNRA